MFEDVEFAPMNKTTAIRSILIAARSAKPGSTIQYAASYAKNAYNLEGHDWKIQCLYILNNLSGWKGETARQVKAFLKAQSK